MFSILQLMVDGDLGHYGIPVLRPVAEESKQDNVSAMTLCPNMVEKIVLVMLLWFKSATNRTALLVCV